jgi:hypothetical protein
MIFGKVTDFNVRGSLRAGAAPSKNQNPFFLSGFEELDKLISAEFLNSLPHTYKNNHGVNDAPSGSTLDTDLYMVHIIPHACVHFSESLVLHLPDSYLRATITLHNPYVDFMDPQCISTARCVNSARSILAAYYMLSATSLDITRLHPFVTVGEPVVPICTTLTLFHRSAGILPLWSKSNFANISLRLATVKGSPLYGEKSMSSGSPCSSTAIDHLLAVSGTCEQFDVP